MILELTTPKSDLSLSTVSTSRFRCLTPAITTVGSPQPLRPSVAQRRHDPYWTAVTHYRRTVAAVRPPPCSEALPSLKEDNDELPYEGLASVAGGIVALGKFDALHVGHRELAIQASKVGVPFLLSFGGMAEVFGWEPRVPIVAKCDRKRVLSSWAPFCGSVVPEEVLIEFASVRHLSPRQFVEKLSKELGVRGVVAGENYRFGYKAAGDASELVRLCDDYGIGAYIIDSVMDKSRVDSVNSCDAKDRGQVSSTRVRYALARGDIHYVTELLGRPHRLMLSVENNTGFVSTKSTISCPKFRLLNLPPGDGLYENCSLVLGDENPVPCRVIIGATHVHVESDDTVYRVLNASQDLQLLAIEFGQV